jgi:hypothetical protein
MEFRPHQGQHIREIIRRLIELVHNGTAFRLERDVIWRHSERALREPEFDQDAAKRDSFRLSGLAINFLADFIAKWSERLFIKGLSAPRLWR